MTDYHNTTDYEPEPTLSVEFYPSEFEDQYKQLDIEIFVRDHGRKTSLMILILDDTVARVMDVRKEVERYIDTLFPDIPRSKELPDRLDKLEELRENLTKEV